MTKAEQLMKGNRVVMPLGHYDFTPDANFFFILIPVKTRGVMQWHRDFLPALRRFVKRRWDWAEKESFYNTITAIDGMDDGLELLANRMRGDNDRVWACWSDGELTELKFEVSA